MQPACKTDPRWRATLPGRLCSRSRFAVVVHRHIRGQSCAAFTSFVDFIQLVSRRHRGRESRPATIVAWHGSEDRRQVRRRGIRPRFGALGKHGSLAVLERAIRTVKEGLRWIIVPTRREAMRTELFFILDWYNQHRPHSTLAGKTPDEVYFQRLPGNRRPRFEPRVDWPRGSPCSLPWALVAGRPGARFDVVVERIAGHAHLPIVRLRRAS
jgi:hypothetical protein